MLELPLIALAFSMVFVLTRAAVGPGWFDRVLALNVFGTLTIVLLVLISVSTKFHALIDIALLYGLINFASTIAILCFFKDQILPLPRYRARLKQAKMKRADV